MCESQHSPTHSENTNVVRSERPGKPGNKIPNAHVGILNIPGTILPTRNSITSTKSTNLSLGLSQASASNHTHLSTAHSPGYLFAWMCSTDAWWSHSNPGGGICVETFQCLMSNRRGRLRREEQGKEERRLEERRERMVELCLMLKLWPSHACHSGLSLLSSRHNQVFKRAIVMRSDEVTEEAQGQWLVAFASSLS